MFDQYEYSKELKRMTISQFRDEVQKLIFKRNKMSEKIQPLISRLEEIEELKEMGEIDIVEYSEEKLELEHKIDKILMKFHILTKKMDVITKYAEAINKYKNKIGNM